MSLFPRPIDPSRTENILFARRSYARAILAGAILATAVAIPSAHSAEVRWLGGAAADATNFNNAANWAGGSLPVIYNEVTNTINGDIAVFDGAQAGLDNKTPTMTAAFGLGIGGGATGSNSETWGLLGVKFVDSGWTFNTGANTLFISQRDTVDLRSDATSGTNTINGSVKFGAQDTNVFSDIYVETGGTLRLNAAIGTVIDGGGNTGGGAQKVGGGVLELNTTGMFGSGLRVFAGIVRLYAESAGGVTGDGTGGIGNANNAPLSIFGGTVDLNGARGTLNPATLVLNAGGVLTNSSLTAETVVTKPGNDQILAGLISGNLNMSFGANATNTTTITNNNSYTGITNIVSSSGGGGTTTVVVTLDVLPNTNSPLGNASSAIVLGNGGNSTTNAALLTGGAVEVGRNITLGNSTNATGLKTIGAASNQVGDSTFSGVITVGTASQTHLRVTAPAGVTVNITGGIVESPTAGNGNVTKVGAGTVRIVGNGNTYAGSTTISAGTLLVAGSLSATSAVNVSAGGTLGGNGVINEGALVSVADAGAIAPGPGVGILNAGSVAFASGGDFKLDLNGAVAGTGYDQLSVTGTVNLNSDAGLGADLFLTLGAGFTPAPFQTFTVVANDGLFDGVTGVFATINGGAFGPGGTFTLTNNMGSFDFQIFYSGEDGATTGGNDVVLQAVPEPGVAAMLAAGLAPLSGFRRNRRRRA